MGPEHRRPCQEEDVNSAGGGGGLAEQALRLSPQTPGVPPLGAVGVWKAVGGRGLGKLDRGLKGVMQPVVASLIFSVNVAMSSGFTCAHLTVNINKF